MFKDPLDTLRHPAHAAHRYFFALRPPPRLARRLANAADWLGNGAQPVAAERLHITLVILPDLLQPSADLVARLRAVGAAVIAAPVEVVLDYVSGSGRSVALRPQRLISGLAELYRMIASLCPSYGVGLRPDHAFSPHVTLGYRRGRPFGQRVAPVGWTATEFVLIHSLIGRTRHEVLGRWPLTPREPAQLGLL